MGKENQTVVTEFILLGFSYQPQIKIVLFLVLLVIYLVTLIANGLIITVALVDSRLHSPMYFFLCNLSFLDLCFSSVNVPTSLKALLFERITIAYSPCIAQLYMGVSLGQTECLLLAVMAWDRYVAICKPLNYQQIMNNNVCITLASVTWTSGFLVSVHNLVFPQMIDFCGHNQIDFPVCEPMAIVRLFCGDIRLIQIVTIVIGIFTLVLPITFILLTYGKIFYTILRMTTAENRYKAFSTCGSHLLVVTIFYGTVIMTYMRPRSTISQGSEKVNFLFYAAVTPVLNPLIYTLRNKDVKMALEKLHSRNMLL